MQMQAFAVPNHRGRVALRSMLPLVHEKSARTWVQLAVEGEWEGHHSGAFEFTPEVFQTIVRNFSKQANPLPLTYEHPEYAGNGMPVIAAGWIHGLEAKRGQRGVELWGHVEFTDRAAEFIRNGEYKFCSVVVDFATTDRVTNKAVGPALHEVGLTNVPFLDGMQPIRLSRRARVRLTKGVGMSDVELILEAIKKLGKEATQADIGAWVEAKRKIDAVESGEGPAAEEAPAEMDVDVSDLSTQPPIAASDAGRRDEAALADPPPPPADAPPPEAAAAVDMAKLVDLIAASAGVDAPTLISFMQEKAESIGAAIGQMLAGEPSGTSAEAQAQAAGQTAMSRKLSVADKTIERLQSQVAELMGEKKKRDDAAAEQVRLSRNADAERVVDEAITAGRALDAERADLVWLQLNEPERLVRMLSARGQVVPTGPAINPKPPLAADKAADEWRKHPEYKTYDRALAATGRLSASARHDKIVERLQARAAK